MKYFEVVDLLLHDSETGFKNIHKSTEQFKNEILAEIKRAKCSIATARVFVGFVELKLERNEPLSLGSTMLEAAIFIGNGVGLDPTRFSETLTAFDLSDLQKVSNFR